METENLVGKKLEQIDEILTSYLKSYGIDIHANDNSITQYIEMSKESIAKLSQEECYEIALLFLQKSTQIQMEINKHTRTYNWANENIKAFIADKIGKYGGQYTPAEMKKTMAIQDNDYTKKLYQVARTTKNYLDTLEYLPMCLKNHADFFNNLARSKKP
jgi:hypothetical protein